MVNESLDILFLGGLFPKGREDEVICNSKRYVQNAANVLQYAIVEGLDINCLEPVRILNALFVGSFPTRYKKLFLNSYPFSHTEGAEDFNVGWFNLIGLSRVSKYFALMPHVKKWAQEKTKKRKIIIAYAATPVFTGILRYAKKLNSAITTCLIVPDLPRYMNTSLSSSAIYSVLKNLETKQILRHMPYIDRYVLLAEHMRDVLGIDVPYVVMEGIATDCFEGVSSVSGESDTKTILYSGILAKRYGLVDLVKAFTRLPNPDYRLVICGEGDSEGFIKLESQKDKRIVFNGLLPRSEVLSLQKSASVLVNPRSNDEEYTRYSFPSKILEYMSSGTPVISYKLDGIPNEYFQYMYTINERGRAEDAIYSTLKDILSKSEEELSEMGKKAREFVLREKNSAVQTLKIIKMIDSGIRLR